MSRHQRLDLSRTQDISESRLEVGPLERPQDVVELRAEADRAGLRESLLAPDVALAGMPAVTLAQEGDGPRFCGGQAVAGPADRQAGLVRVYAASGEFLGVGECSGDGSIAPRRVFKNSEKTP